MKDITFSGYLISHIKTRAEPFPVQLFEKHKKDTPSHKILFHQSHFLDCHEVTGLNLVKIHSAG